MNVSRLRHEALSHAYQERALPEVRRDLARLEAELATGQRVQRASDDPAAYARARAFDGLIARNAQYDESIATARTWTLASQDALDALTDRFAEAYEVAVQGASGALSADDRAALADRVDGLRAAVLDLLNARHEDEYLFAGQRTVEGPPFTDAGAGVLYGGTGAVRSHRIGESEVVAVGIPGDRLFSPGGGPSLTDRLDALAGVLRTGTVADVNATLDGLEAARAHLARLGAEAGDQGRRLDLAAAVLADQRAVYEGARSQAEDADLAETIARIQQAQLQLQAALKATAQTLQTTLLDYLR